MFLLNILSVHAQEPVQLMQTSAHAENLYRQSKWHDALMNYEKIEPKPSAIWYNMGNCSYYLHNYPYALACWLKAIPGASGEELQDIKHNITRLTDQFVMELGHKPLWIEELWYERLVKSIEWAAFQLLFLLLWFSLAYMILYKKRKAYIWMGSVGLCSVLFFMINKYYIEQRNYAVIKNNQTKVLVGPDHHFHALGFLNQADCVRIMEIKKEWAAVRGHGIEGWIETGTMYRV